LGVLGIIFSTKTGTTSKVLQPIIDSLSQVASVSTTPVKMTQAIKLSTLLPTVWDVFRYEGSLTTPPCSEKILWSVFTQKMPVSQAQVDAFRAIKDGSGKAISLNYRPIKPVVTKTRKYIYWMPVDKKKMLANAF